MVLLGRTVGLLLGKHVERIMLFVRSYKETTVQNFIGQQACEDYCMLLLALITLSLNHQLGNKHEFLK